MSLVEVGRCSEIAEGEARIFQVGAEPVAVFNAAGGFYACRSVCPHRGGPLGEGDFDGRLITCPWHGWQFDVATGVNPLMPAAKLQTFPVRIDGDRLQVDLP